MKKKYLSALLFGAIIAASSVTFTSCKDYDDEINNLQEQIDATSSKVPTTEAMKEAINAAKADLQAKIDAADNQEEIDALKARVTELEKLQGRIDALEATLSSTYYTKDQVESLIGTEINKAVDALFKVEDGKYSGAIVTYIQSVLAAETVSKTDFEALEKAWNDFVKESNNTSLKDIESKLRDLELFKQATIEAMTEENFENFAAVLEQIKKNESAIAGLAIPDADDIIKIVQEELAKQDGIFKEIQESLKQLGIDVESLKSMIQSIVYVPINGTDKINITTLYAEDNAGDWQVISNSEAGKVTFRVSPASAADKFAENYVVSVYSEELSRAEQPISVGEITSKGNGLVEIEMKADNIVKDYAVCLHVTPKKVKGNADKNTDITSDYFIINTGNLYLETAAYELSPNSKLMIGDKTDSNVDFTTEGKITLTVKDSPTSTSSRGESLENLNLPKDLFTVSHEIVSGSDANKFELVDGKLSVKASEQKVQNAGLSCTVKSTIKVVGNDNVPAYDISRNTVNIWWEKSMDLGSYEIDYNYLADQFVDIPLSVENEILANLNNGTWRNCTSDFGTEDIRFDLLTSGRYLQIFVGRGATTEAPLAVNGSLVVTNNQYIKVNLSANVTVNYVLPVAEKDMSQWSEGNIYIPYVASSHKLIYTDLTDLFTNFNEMKAAVAAMGGTLEFTEILPTTAQQGLVSISGVTMTINPSKYKGEAIGLKLEAVFSPERRQTIAESTANVKVFDYNNLSGELDVTTPYSVVFDKQNNPVYTAIDMYKTDWDWKVEGVSVKHDLGLYGLFTKVILDNNAKEWLEINGTGFNQNVVVKQEKWNMTTLLQDQVFDVTIKFYTPWESISDSDKAWTEKTTTVKVTIKKWNKNN